MQMHHKRIYVAFVDQAKKNGQSLYEKIKHRFRSFHTNQGCSFSLELVLVVHDYWLETSIYRLTKTQLGLAHYTFKYNETVWIVLSSIKKYKCLTIFFSRCNLHYLVLKFTDSQVVEIIHEYKKHFMSLFVQKKRCEKLN